MNLNIPDSAQKRVVIVGGGFGGLNLIHHLKGKEFQVVLIDKNNFHQFPPLLYQVASAGLEPSSITFPYRKVFQNHKNFFFRLAEVRKVIPEQKMIETSIGSLTYDYLVLSSGTKSNYFGNEEIEKNTLPMKAVDEAVEIRNALLVNFEKALTSLDPEEKQSLLNIVIVGGGPTGVEIAGALAEMKRFIIPKDYPDLYPFEVNIFLVEGGPHLLGAMSPEASEHAEKYLEEMGVTLFLNKKVIECDGAKVTMDDHHTISSKAVIWVSGVTATQFENVGERFTGHAGRILVDEYSQVKGMPDVFAIGDISLMMTEDVPKGHPQLAQVAIQQGRLLADNLKRSLKGESFEPFHYKDLGTLATIGRNKAVADLGKVKLHGFTAWYIWLFVHLRSLLGVKNKLMVLFDWMWNYIIYDQAVRFILYVPNKQKTSEEKKMDKDDPSYLN